LLGRNGRPRTLTMCAKKQGHRRRRRDAAFAADLMRLFHQFAVKSETASPSHLSDVPRG
jgi:hypothetical protein